MSRKRIKTVSDFLALSEEEFERIAPDFCHFYFLTKELKKKHGDNIKVDEFVWIDDGEVGVKEVILIDSDGVEERKKI